MFFNALTADQVETPYGTRYAKSTLNQSLTERDMLSILSPWLIKTNMVPTNNATLIALITTLRERATAKNLY